MRQTTNDFHTDIVPSKDVYLLNNPPPRKCDYCRRNACIILPCILGLCLIIGVLTMLNVYVIYEEYGSLSI